MVYTNNVPQANQQIANTQAPIQANFQFLQTGLSQEHFFSAGGTGSNMTHTKVSMANLSTPEVLPAFTNGMYYVLGGDAKFLAGDGVKCELTKGVSATSGWQWLGRVLIQWGTIGATTPASSTTNFIIPFPTAVFNIQATLTRGTTAPSSEASITIRRAGGSPTLTQFAWTITGSTQVNGFHWLAIGY